MTNAMTMKKVMVWMLGLVAAIVVTVAGQQDVHAQSMNPQATSRTCFFVQGPMISRAQSFPHAQPIPVGSPCHDGRGSTGYAIFEPAVPTNVCVLTWGPRAGVKFNTPRVWPAGVPCHDGQGSRGMMMPAQTATPSPFPQDDSLPMPSPRNEGQSEDVYQGGGQRQDPTDVPF